MIPIHIETLTDLLQWRSAESPLQSARGYRLPSGKWQTETWQGWYEEVLCLAYGLVNWGIGPGDRVAIHAPTSHVWQTFEFAAMLVGAGVVGIDTCSPPLVRDHQLQLVQPRLLVTTHAQHIADVSSTVRDSIQYFLCLNDFESNSTACRINSIDELRRFGTSSHVKLPTVHEQLEATVVFTSGTTGDSKAISYTHGQVVQACRSILSVFPQGPRYEKAVCWLPMSHLFQRIFNLAAIARGSMVYFVDDPRDVVNTAVAVSPTVLVGVPRFFERLHAGILEGIQRLSWPQRLLVKMGLEVASRHGQHVRRNSRVPLRLGLLHAIMDQLVLKQLRGKIGRSVQWMITGSAPMDGTILNFFHDIGCPLLEAYGLSENVIPMTANTPVRYRIGSVGTPLPGNEIRLSAEGEVLVKGPGVFHGYLGEASQLRNDSGGFYPTGDLGSIDAAGFLYLTGRKSDMIKTSTGRRVAPLRLQTLLRQHALVQEAIVIGNGRRFLTALVLLDFGQARTQFPHLVEATEETIAADDQVNLAIQSHLANFSASLTEYETIRRFRILPRTLSVNKGEMTPTLKPCVRVVELHFATEIEELYAIDAPATGSTHGVREPMELAR